MITNPQRQILLLRDYQFSNGQNELNDTIAQDEYLQAAYQKIKIAALSPYFTLVPERLYNPSEKRTYLQEIAPLSYDKDIRVDELRAVQARTVYALPQALTSTLQKQLAGGQLYHAVSAFLAGLMLLTPSTTSTPTLYFQVYPGWLIAAILEGKSLLFVNSFNYQNAKDFLYYALLVLDQYKLSAEDTPIYISGQLIEQSEIYPLLRRYLRKLQFITPPPFVHFGTKWQQQPTYFYFNLFGLTTL